MTACSLISMSSAIFYCATSRSGDVDGYRTTIPGYQPSKMLHEEAERQQQKEYVFVSFNCVSHNNIIHYKILLYCQ